MRVIQNGILIFISIILLQVIEACVHDQIITGQTLTPIDDSNDHIGRLLQANRIGGMRIHYQYNTTDVQQTDAIGRNIIKIMNIIAVFWERTIEMPQRNLLSFNIDASFDRNNFQCLGYRVPRTLLDSGVPQKDFGILVQAKNDGDNGVTAFSFPCAYSSVDRRPMWGLVHWNKNYIKLDPVSFQENLHIATHQIVHLFGFSSLLYPLFKNNPSVKIGATSYLTGSFIRTELVRQYGCISPPGMPLQENGGTGTALSHWSRKVAHNQLMTAGVSTSNPTLSYITLALLQETGWYTRVHKYFGKFVNYGYRKGCSFLSPQDCSFPEYCTTKSQLQCNYDRVSLGYCRNDSLSACLYVKYYSNFICIDPNYNANGLHAKIVNDTGEQGGRYSRCFQSDLRVTGSNASKYSFRCYQTFCSPNNRSLAVKVGNQAVLCLFPNQKIKVRGYEGLLTCPKSFIQACAVIRCPNQCNSNGVCFNGVCLCQKSYTGEDCSKVSSVGLANVKDIFDPSQNNGCQSGTYLDQFGDCDLCPKGCILCQDSQNCVRCYDDVLPVAGKCLE